MIKSHLFKAICFSFFLYFFVHVIPVSAQNPVVNNVNLKVYGCINAVLCNPNDINSSNNVNCPSSNSDQHDVYPHRSRVFSTALLEPNVDVYVAECIDTDEGRICTTGSHSLDRKIFCGSSGDVNDPATDICDHYAILQSKSHGYYLYPDRPWIGYTVYYSNFTGYTNKATALSSLLTLTRTANGGERHAVRTDANGRLPIIEWQALTNPETSRTYAVFQIVSPTPTPTPAQAPGIGGQQQASLVFSSSGSGVCDTVTYDPYGRVFDSMSLEPIPNASVSLLQLDPSSQQFSLQYAQSRSFININPQPSFVDGRFSFLVEDGDYKLEPSFNGYNLLSKSETALGLNATKIYSDLYYSDSTAIEQRGKIQHRDIPMSPADGVGKLYDLQIISQNTEAIVKKNQTFIKFSGRVSHPFVRAEVYICGTQIGAETETCNPYKTYTSGNGGPDKNGEFSFEIDQKEIQSGKRFKVDFVKQDLTKSIQSRVKSENRFVASIRKFLGIKQIFAQETKTSTSQYIEPIFAYIEGYAYGSNGAILPNARVNIHIPFAQIPVYTTNADSSGFYRITSENLPKSAYTISYTSGENIVSEITTSQFLAQNNEFILSEEIDLMTNVTAKTNARREVTPTFIPQTQISPVASNSVVTASPVERPDQEAAQTRNPAILVGAILLILVGGAGVMLAIYIYKKRSAM